MSRPSNNRSGSRLGTSQQLAWQLTSHDGTLRCITQCHTSSQALVPETAFGNLSFPGSSEHDRNPIPEAHYEHKQELYTPGARHICSASSLEEVYVCMRPGSTNWQRIEWYFTQVPWQACKLFWPSDGAWRSPSGQGSPAVLEGCSGCQGFA